MNTTGFVKYAGALVALAICSACGGGSAVAPSNAGLNGAYIGRTLSVNGMLVTAARPNLSPLPRYATIVSDGRAKSKTFEYIINFYGSYASSSRRAAVRSKRSQRATLWTSPAPCSGTAST